MDKRFSVTPSESSRRELPTRGKAIFSGYDTMPSLDVGLTRMAFEQLIVRSRWRRLRSDVCCCWWGEIWCEHQGISE